ncbi:MAG: hypothetical protein LBC82_00075 [Oscillospiraceae bacterium]|jgi:hypothetical protein|nr:hypothetical protein [Oscillospiraceae bacterium]
MKKHEKNLSLRIDPELLKKFRYVARYDDRSMNWYMTKLISACITKFEAKHGEIEFNEEDGALPTKCAKP